MRKEPMRDNWTLHAWWAAVIFVAAFCAIGPAIEAGMTSHIAAKLESR